MAKTSGDLNDRIDELFMKTFDFLEKTQIVMTDITFVDSRLLAVSFNIFGSKMLFFRVFVVYVCVEENTSGHVCVL